MDDVTDQELLARHLAGDRDEAFRQLVQRHSGLVYHAARRIVGSHEAAQDVTQTVFILLSTKAVTLRSHTSLAGWLYRSATFVARDFLKSAHRRLQRESELQMDESTPSPWEEIAPHLDASLEHLPESDRHAILLRFFERRSLREVGLALGLSDDSAQKRIRRALDRLRTHLLCCGVTVSTAALAEVISSHAAPAVPGPTLALLGSSSAAASLSVQSLVNSSLKALFMKKLKIVLTSATVALMFAGGAGAYLHHPASPGYLGPRTRTTSPILVLEELASAAGAHRGDRIAGLVHVTRPDRRQRLGILTEVIDAVGALEGAARRVFGAAETDAALWKNPPLVLFRLEFGQEQLGSAFQTTSGDTARVIIERSPGFRQFISFIRVDGAWKIDESNLDDVITAVNADAFARAATDLRDAARRVDAGAFPTAEALADHLRTLPGPPTVSP